MRSRRVRVGLGLGALVVVGTFAAGSAGAVNVGVTLASGGGDRTLYVRDALDQNDLTSIDFGDARSRAFTVRVEDSAFDNDPFTVSAEMTNLYVFRGGQWVYDPDTAPSIPSSDLSISSIDGVDGSVASAVLQPVADLTATITGVLCTTLGLGASPCTINLSDVVARNLPVVPAGLPIVPQAPEAGAFTAPAYTSDAPDAPGDQTTWDDGTARRLLGGDLNVDPAFLAGLVTQAQDAIDAAVTTGTTAQLENVVDPTVLQSALDTQTSLTGLLINNLLAAVSGVVWDVTVGSVDIVSQTASYRSNPVLNVAVPESATEPTYRGTLVITGVG